MYYQQGDVIINKIDIIPDGIKINKKENGYIIAEGELTGHCHSVIDEIELIEKDGVLYIKANNDFTITHQEHNKIKIPAGNYEIGRVQEYDHFKEEAKIVQD